MVQNLFFICILCVLFSEIRLIDLCHLPIMRATGVHIPLRTPIKLRSS